MPSPIELETETTPPPVKRYKMALLNDEYLVDVSGNDGRYPKGAVLLVDEATAIRWFDRNVAEPADPNAPTFGEIRRETKKKEFLRRAKPAEGVYDQAITRGSFRDDPNNRQIMPPPMPVPGRRPGRPRRADLEGAEVVTDTTDEDNG